MLREEQLLDDFMKARKGRLKQKADSPSIGNWLRRYVIKRTCRAWKRCTSNSAICLTGGKQKGGAR